MGFDSTLEPAKPSNTAATVAQRDNSRELTKAATVGDEGSDHEISDELEIAQQGFHWYALKASSQLDELQQQIDAAKDDPPWNERIADHILETALQLGAMASGSVLASAAVKSAGVSEDGLAKDGLKDIFKGGIGAGIAKGRATMKAKGASLTSARFITMQKDAINAAASEDQKHFIRTTRHRVKSVDEAQALSQMCSQETMYAAATAQASVVRDLWVTYVAQGRLGTVQVSSDNRPTTDLSNQYERDRRAASDGQLFPVEAPTLGAAMHGDSLGVLSVQADAFPFDAQGRSLGGAEVDFAYLGGVSDGLRAQYENNTLENAHIPRHLHVRVVNGYKARTPNFDVNIDEAGNPQGLKEVESKWLRQKYRSSHSGAMADPSTEVREGVAALLRELRVGKIKRPVGG